MEDTLANRDPCEALDESLRAFAWLIADRD
jgi:hypothetical protein